LSIAIIFYLYDYHFSVVFMSHISVLGSEHIDSYTCG